MLDNDTILVLVIEAEGKHRLADKRFQKWDNSDDMHEVEAWEHTIKWLKSKLRKSKLRKGTKI